MLDLLAATTAFTAVVAVLLLVLVGLTVVPFVVATTMAERRRFSTARWGALALGVAGAGLLLAAVLWTRTDVPRPIAALPVLLTWAGPGVLWLLEGSEELLGGRRGAHE